MVSSLRDLGVIATSALGLGNERIIPLLSLAGTPAACPPMSNGMVV
jgi:hypothetical protein